MPKAADTRDRIISAAEEIVLDEGAARLTIESAAQGAGLSKGGVLYHFPTRSSLVTAMVSRLVAQFDQALTGAGSGDAEPGASSRAYVRSTFRPSIDRQAEREDRLGAALFAAVASEPDLLEPLRQGFTAWQAALDDDGIDPIVATLLRLAADGLWLSDIFGFAPLDPERRTAVADVLERLSRAGPPARPEP